MKEKLLDKLRIISELGTWSDDADFNPMEYSGSNFDDAYWGGFDDGRVDLARELLKEAEDEEETDDGQVRDWYVYIKPVAKRYCRTTEDYKETTIEE